MTPTLAPAKAARAVNWPRVLFIGILAAIGVSLLVGLGAWQLQRRVWKLDLIRKVETRFYAPPHALQNPAAIDPANHEYEHLTLTGTYLAGLDTWVHALTVDGAGYWILTPLRTNDDQIVLVNRGFVPMDTVRSKVTEAAEKSVTGVLRTSEPSGVWPRRNEPAKDRWYSRDVAAIAHARGLQGVLPFFIDADAQPSNDALAGAVRPVGGLTVVTFRNAHLSYALTWFALALMAAMAGVIVLRRELHGHA